MEPADIRSGNCKAEGFHHREGIIRKLGIGLLAAAAIVASLTLAKNRVEPRRVATPDDTADRAEEKFDLDAIRDAGF